MLVKPQVHMRRDCVRKPRNANLEPHFTWESWSTQSKPLTTKSWLKKSSTKHGTWHHSWLKKVRWRISQGQWETWGVDRAMLKIFPVFMLNSKNPNKSMAIDSIKLCALARSINVNFVDWLESMRNEKISLHLVRKATSAINGIISPPCANLRIIVATNPENRSQAERIKEGLRKQPLTTLNSQARMMNMLNLQTQMTNFSVRQQSTWHRPRK